MRPNLDRSRPFRFAHLLHPIALAAGVALATGCGPFASGGAGLRPDVPPPSPAIELRTFMVPAGYAERVAQALNRAFDPGSDEPQVARATVAPGGTLVVVAPGSVLDGVSALVDGLAALPPEPTPRNVELEYWVVRGVQAPQVAHGAGLDAVVGVLDAIAQHEGPRSFELLAARRLKSLDGERADSEDRAVSLEQIASIAPGGGVIADIGVKLADGGRTRTRLALAPGETSVLAEGGGEGPGGEPADVYVLVRASIP